MKGAKPFGVGGTDGSVSSCWADSAAAMVQADDGEAEEERPIVDDQGNEGDADATDTKRQEKQEEEVRLVVTVPPCLQH